ncbi:sulfotransferase [Salinibacter ruber]|uniref:sulfotransferase n=1 Tax=Salinibacter ruber TaxID=146919 RepID=UPI00311A9B2A
MSPSVLRRTPRHGANLIQVVGTPRSGSTLLATMLDAHSQAVCLIEPYLAWLKHGEYEYNWNQLDRPDVKRFSKQQPQRLFAFLCAQTEFSVIGFKETYRTPYHPTFPSQSFLEQNQSTGAVDATVAIIRDPRDTWSSVVRRHPHFRGDTGTMAELIHAWNELCRWVERKKHTVVRYEDLVSHPREIESVLGSVGLTAEDEVYRPEGTAGYGDSRAQKGGGIDDSSVGKYRSTLSDGVSRFIEAQCSEHMRRFDYNWPAGSGHL